MKHFHLSRLLLNAVAACVLSCGVTAAEEIVRWDFDKEPIGWKPNSETELSLEDGHLKVASRGNDPYFTTEIDGHSGSHRITMTATLKGNADVQVFWTTAADPKLSEEKSMTGQLRGSEKESRTLKLYFATDSPVTSIRIDPLSRRGTMLIDSIELTDDASPLPVATPVAVSYTHLTLPTKLEV